MHDPDLYGDIHRRYQCRMWRFVLAWLAVTVAGAGLVIVVIERWAG